MGSLTRSRYVRHRLVRRLPVVALAVAVIPAASAWTASPVSARVGDYLTGVSATSAANAWAVGYYFGKNGITRSLAEHWNGNKWRKVASANPSPGYNELDAVSALSAKDAWAVGIKAPRRSSSQTNSDCLTEHWNGTRWTAVPDASHGRLLDCHLDSVTAISAKDAWAVGTYLHVRPGHHAGAILSLVEHWNGKSWRRVASPNPAGQGLNAVNTLRGVAASSRRDVWAVGSYGQVYNTAIPLIERWNGSRWSRARHLSLPGSAGGLNAVAARSALAWAVGSPATTLSAGPYALRLSHGRWHKVAVPAGHPKLAELSAVAVTSATSAWAVGSYGRQPWIVHWNGSKWLAVRAPHPGGRLLTRLVAVTAPRAAATWAVGTVGHGGLSLRAVTLIEHWTGAKWVRVPSPNPLP